MLSYFTSITANTNDKIKELTKQNETLTKEKEDLMKQNETLTKEKEDLTKEKERINRDNQNLKQDSELYRDLVFTKMCRCNTNI